MLFVKTVYVVFGVKSPVHDKLGFAIVTNANLHYDNREERVDMCEAIEGIRNDARAEGKAEGRAEGKAEGKAEGMEIGFLKALVSLVKDGILTITDAAKRAGMTVAEFENKTKLLEQ